MSIYIFIIFASVDLITTMAKWKYAALHFSRRIKNVEIYTRKIIIIKNNYSVNNVKLQTFRPLTLVSSLAAITAQRNFLEFFPADPLKLHQIGYKPYVNCDSSGLSTDVLWGLTLGFLWGYSRTETCLPATLLRRKASCPKLRLYTLWISLAFSSRVFLFWLQWSFLVVFHTYASQQGWY